MPSSATGDQQVLNEPGVDVVTPPQGCRVVWVDGGATSWATHQREMPS